MLHVLVSSIAGALAGAGVLAGGVDPARVQWVKEHSIAFKTCEAGNGLEDLDGLKAVIGSARIVALGEPTHGTREAFQMKHRLVEFLAKEMGFTVFSIEASMPESFAVSDFTVEGKGDAVKAIEGMYFWTWRTNEVLGMVEWMKEYNKTAPAKLLFTGFDMQQPRVAGKIAGDFCDAHAPELAERERAALTETLAAMQAGNGGGGFGVATGAIPVDVVKGKKLTISGWIRTEMLINGFAGLWARADKADGTVGAFDNMAERGPKGTTDWQAFSLELAVPADAVNINFGAIMPGQGDAFFDDVEIKVDGQALSMPGFDGSFEGAAVKGLFSQAGGAYKVAISDQKPHGGAGCLRISGKPAESGAESSKTASEHAQAAYEAMKAKRDELVTATSAKDADWAIQNARVLAQCAGMFHEMRDGGSGGLNARDRSMAENVAWILEQNPGAKIVLWAHNAHVAKATLWNTKWMGASLNERFPGEMVTLGFSTSRGRYTAMSDQGLTDHPLQAVSEGSVEEILSAVGEPRLIVDLRGSKSGDAGSGWARSPMKMRSIGAMAMDEQFTSVTPAEAFDLIVHIEETSAAVQIPRK